MNTTRKLAWLCLATGLLAGCGPAQDESGERQSRAGEGREETRNIRNTENIGYAGNAIGAKVDEALDVNDNRKSELDKQLEGAEQGN